MPFVTKITECDKTLLSQLQLRYGNYFPGSGFNFHAFSISLYNLNAARVLENYHLNQSALLRSILMTRQAMLEQDALDLASLNPTDPVLQQFFRFIEKYGRGLPGINLLARLKKHRLLINTSGAFSFFQENNHQYPKLVYAIDALAKANYSLNYIILQDLADCRDTISYADAIIELLSKNDFSHAETNRIRVFLKSVINPVGALNYIIRLRSHNLDHLFLFDNCYQNLDFYGLLNGIKLLEDNTPLTAQLVNILHTCENPLNLAQVVVHMIKNLQNDTPDQPQTLSLTDKICALLSEPIFVPIESKIHINTKTANQPLLLRRFYFPAEYHYAITHLATLTPGCLTAMKKVEKHYLALTSNLFRHFAQSNSELNQPSHFISLCEIISVLFKIIHPNSLIGLLKTPQGTITLADFNNLIKACKNLMTQPVDAKILMMNQNIIAGLMNQFTVQMPHPPHLNIIGKPVTQPALLPSGNPNKRTYPDEKISDKDSKASDTQLNSAKKAKSALAENSFLNTMNVTGNVNKSQVQPNLSDAKTEADLNMLGENLSPSKASGPRTVQLINLEITRLLARTKGESSFMHLRNKALFNIHDDKALETLIHSLKPSNGSNTAFSNELKLFAHKANQLLNERTTLIRDNNTIASMLAP